MALDPIEHVPTVYEPYVCEECGAEGCKLWRMGASSSVDLRCVHCASKETKVPFVQPAPSHPNPSYTIGDYVLAVPSPTGSFWGITSVPSDDFAWWKALPTWIDNYRVRDDGTFVVSNGSRPLNDAYKHGMSEKAGAAVMFDYEEIERPDHQHCQTDVPTGHTFMTLGGQPGTRARCGNKPTMIAVENKPGLDGLYGSMSLCRRCHNQFKKDYPESFATIVRIPKVTEHPDVAPYAEPYQPAVQPPAPPPPTISRFKQTLPDQDKRFADTKYIVEATSTEKRFLWCEWHDGCDWVQDSAGTIVTIGNIEAEGKAWPVCVSCFWSVINGVRVLFYECTSMVTHHEWAEQWVRAACGDPSHEGRTAHTDAMNFGHAMSAVEKLSGKPCRHREDKRK